MTLFEAAGTDPIVEKLNALELDYLSPKRALELLYEIQNSIRVRPTPFPRNPS
jgi:hypothetical protein